MHLTLGSSILAENILVTGSMYRVHIPMISQPVLHGIRVDCDGVPQDAA